MANDGREPTTMRFCATLRCEHLKAAAGLAVSYCPIIYELREAASVDDEQ